MKHTLSNFFLSALLGTPRSWGAAVEKPAAMNLAARLLPDPCCTCCGMASVKDPRKRWLTAITRSLDEFALMTQAEFLFMTAIGHAERRYGWTGAL